MLGSSWPEADSEDHAARPGHGQHWCALAQEEPFFALQITAALSRRAGAPASMPLSSSSLSRLQAGPSFEAAQKMLSLLGGKGAALGRAAFTAWQRHRESSTMVLLGIVFMFFILTFVGVSLYYNMPELKSRPEPAAAAPVKGSMVPGSMVAPPPKFFQLPGVAVNVMAPHQWPKSEKLAKGAGAPGPFGGAFADIGGCCVSKSSGGPGETNGRNCYSIPGQLLEGLAGASQSVLDSTGLIPQVATSSISHIGPNNNGESGGGDDDGIFKEGDISIHGALCPYIHATESVTFTTNGAFLKDPRGSFDLTFSNDNGKEMFSMYIRPCASTAGCPVDEARQVSLSWFGKDPDQGHGPLAVFKRLDDKTSAQESEAIKSGSIWGVFDMYDRLWAHIGKKVETSRSSFGFARSIQAKDNTWTAKKVQRQGGVTKLSTLCEIRDLPTLPMHPQDLQHVTTRNIQSKHRMNPDMAEVSAAHGDGTMLGSRDKITIRVVGQEDMAFHILCLFGMLVFQPVTEEAISGFEGQACDSD